MLPNGVMENPRRLHVEYLHTVILFPDDEAARQAEIDRAMIALLQAEDPRAEVPIALVREMLERARGAQPREEIVRRMRNASIAAEIVQQCLAYGRQREPKMNAIAESIGDWPLNNLSASAVKNEAWKNWRPVAHLASAWFILQRHYADADMAVDALCRAEDVPSFLAIAEHVRREGEKLTRVQATGPVLDSDTTWKVPADIAARLPPLPPGFAFELK
jgi:hypothetical protein